MINYEAKERYASNLMKANKEIESLTEEQHDALAEVCRIRHYLHSYNVEKLYTGEYMDEFFGYIENDNQQTINDILEAAGLEVIDELNNIDIESIETEADWDYVLDDEDKEAYDNDSDNYRDHCIEIYADIKNQINNAIETYLLGIDKEHGTQYCPTGFARLRQEVIMAKYSEKQNQWTQAYIKKAYDSILVRVPKGDKEKYQSLAESKGISLNRLIVDFLEKEIEKCP